VDLFGFSITAAGDGLRAAAIAAGHELGVFDGRAWTLDTLADANGIEKGRRRMRPLIDLLVGLGALRRDGDRVIAAAVPAKPEVARTGWGAMVDVFRGDKALDVEGGEVERRHHQQLTEAAAPEAAELAPLLAGTSLLDLGCGAGTYTAAYLDHVAGARALAIDFWDVVPLAKQFLARFGERAQVLGDEISTVQGSDAYEVALLSNVLHLHAPVFCAKYVARAARLVAPGGRLVIKELRVDEDRGGPLASLMFALNLAIYTGGGDVYPTSQLRAWLEEVDFTAIEEHRLASSPDSIVLVAHKPRGATRIFEAITGLVTEDILPPAAPAGLRVFARHAVAAVPELGESIRIHYAIEMPRRRAAQLVVQPSDPGNALLHHPLGWSRLPRMRAAIERLFTVLHEAGVTTGVLGFATPRALFGEAASLARLYERTYRGGTMPLLDGEPFDLAYFAARGDELGLDRDGVIDRYLTAPVVRELCHFAPDRDALPPHLDACMAGWLAVYVWPELAYPAAGWDDAIYAAPWPAQVGQAFARAFGIRAIVRAQTGAIPWDAALPPALVEALTRRAWDDWTDRRSLHFLADTLDPDPWVALALAAMPDDAAFDRQITGDALRAMCLDHQRVAGSLRTRTRALEAAIHVDAVASQVATAPRNELDVVAPRYWLPPMVAGAIRARGHAGYDLFLGSAEAIPAVVETLCTGAAPENFTLIPRELGDA